MQNQLRMSVLSVLSALFAVPGVAACASAQATEAFGGVGRVAVSTPSEASQGHPRGIVLGDRSRMPAEVAADLAALNQALPEAARSGTLDFVVKHSLNGRAVSVELRLEPRQQVTEPLGVWIWPNWRNAANVLHFDQYSEVRWLSNHHVSLMHRPDRGGWYSRVFDVRAPHRPFQFTGFKLEWLRVADNGRWACVANDGALIVGRLDYDDDQWMTRVVTIPVPAEEPIKSLMFLHGGTVLVHNATAPAAEGRAAGDRCVLRTFVLGDGTATAAMTMEGINHSSRAVLKDQHFFGYVPEQQQIGLFTVTPGGLMSWQLVGYDTPFHERPVSVSPSSLWRKSFGLRTSGQANLIVAATRLYHCGYCFVAAPRSSPPRSPSPTKHFRHRLPAASPPARRRATSAAASSTPCAGRHSSRRTNRCRSARPRPSDQSGSHGRPDGRPANRTLAAGREGDSCHARQSARAATSPPSARVPSDARRIAVGLVPDPTPPLPLPRPDSGGTLTALAGLVALATCPVDMLPRPPEARRGRRRPRRHRRRGLRGARRCPTRRGAPRDRPRRRDRRR